MKKLIALIPTQDKTIEQLADEAWEAIQKCEEPESECLPAILDYVIAEWRFPESYRKYRAHQNALDSLWYRLRVRARSAAGDDDNRL
jgi:hypothetical protein